MKPETVKFLIEQAKAGKLGAHDGDACLYRGRHKCCGIGSLIPPHVPIGPNENWVGIETLWQKRRSIAKYLRDAHGLSKRSATELQEIHDSSFYRRHGKLASFNQKKFCAALVKRFGQPA